MVARLLFPGGDDLEEERFRAPSARSFTGETLVLMADGSTKRIDEIEVGDKVANSDPESDNLERHEVTAVHVTDADKDYIDLTVLAPEGVETINTTAHHPFYSVTAGDWVDATDLKGRRRARHARQWPCRRRVGTPVHGTAADIQPDRGQRPHLLRARW